MLLFKIPNDLFQDIMTHFHHDAPLEESGKIKVNAENVQGARDSSGKSLGQLEGDGLDNLDKPIAAPVFTG
jgi:hypothetical protein